MERLADLKRELLTSRDDIDSILNRYQPKLSHEFSLAPHVSQIEHCFSAPSVEEIIERYRILMLNRQSSYALRIHIVGPKIGHYSFSVYRVHKRVFSFLYAD